MSQGGSWDTEYGHFFLGWYSSLLLQHADRVLKAAAASLNKRGRPRKARAAREHTAGHVVYEFDAACHLGVKLAGVHWWFKSRAHAAELTAGYYNTRERDGYAELMTMLRRNSARLSFTCVEMRDCEHPPEGRCSPQGERSRLSLQSLTAFSSNFGCLTLQQMIDTSGLGKILWACGACQDSPAVMCPLSVTPVTLFSVCKYMLWPGIFIYGFG